MMKRSILIIALLSCIVTTGVTVRAQDIKTFRFGLFGGPNLSTMTVDFDHKSRIGYQVGVVAEVNPVEFCYINAAVSYIQKGVVFKDGRISALGDKYDVTATPGYVQVSPHLGLRAVISEGFSIFGEFGPFWAYGVTGRLKDKDGSNRNKIDYFSSDGETYLGAKPNRLDYGLSGVVGVEIGNGCKLGVSYDHGLKKAFSHDNPVLKDGKTRSLTLQITVMM